MFGSCENSLNFDSDSSGGSNSDSSFISMFSRKRGVIATFGIKHNDVMEVRSLYNAEDHITYLKQQLTISSFGEE